MTIEKTTFHKGFIKQNPEDFNRQLPLDTAQCDVLAQNIDNLYFGHVQVRVNTVFRSEKGIGNTNNPIAANDVRFVETFGPFPITILKSGKPAPLYGECLAGSTNGSIIIRMRPQGLPVVFPRVTDSNNDIPNVGRFAFASASPTWRQFSHPNKCIRMPLGDVVLSPLSSRLKDGAGDQSADQPMVCVDVFGASPTGATSTVNLYALYLTEVPFDIEEFSP